MCMCKRARACHRRYEMLAPKMINQMVACVRTFAAAVCKHVRRMSHLFPFLGQKYHSDMDGCCCMAASAMRMVCLAAAAWLLRMARLHIGAAHRTQDAARGMRVAQCSAVQRARCGAARGKCSRASMPQPPSEATGQGLQSQGACSLALRMSASTSAHTQTEATRLSF